MGISNFLNSLFGKAKVTADEVIVKATEVATDVKENIDGFTEIASKKIDEMQLSEKVNEFVETAKVKVEEASDWAEEKANEAKDTFEDIVDKAEEKIESFKNKPENENKEESN